METKNKTYIITAIFAIVSCCVIVFLVYPTWKDIKDISNQIILDKSKSILVDLENATLDDFKKNYERYEPNLKKIDQLFIDPENPVDFIKFLEKTGRDTRISTDIDLTRMGQSGIKNNPQVTDFQIYAKGDFSDMLAFSEKLEAGPYLVNVYDITIKRSASPRETPGQQGSTVLQNVNEVDASFFVEAFRR